VGNRWNWQEKKLKKKQNDDLLEINNQIYLLPNTTLWTPFTCLLINFPHLPICEHHITCDPKTLSQSPKTPKKINYQMFDHRQFDARQLPTMKKILSSRLPCTRRLFNYLVLLLTYQLTYSSTWQLWHIFVKLIN
jgi:hypothetical protein